MLVRDILAMMPERPPEPERSLFGRLKRRKPRGLFDELLAIGSGPMDSGPENVPTAEEEEGEKMSKTLEQWNDGLGHVTPSHSQGAQSVSEFADATRAKEGDVETAADGTVAQPAQRTQTVVRKLLMKQIGVVLRAREEYNLCQANLSAASNAAKAALARTENLNLGPCNDPEQAIKLLEEFVSAFPKSDAAAKTEHLARVAESASMVTLLREYDILSELHLEFEASLAAARVLASSVAADQVSSLPSRQDSDKAPDQSADNALVKSAEILLAHCKEFRKAHSEFKPYGPEFSEPPPLSFELETEVGSLMSYLRDMVEIVAKANGLAAELTALSQELDLLYWPGGSAKLPVRPTEEEVQRFLRQIEEFMMRRQRTKKKIYQGCRKAGEIAASIRLTRDEITKFTYEGEPVVGRSVQLKAYISHQFKTVAPIPWVEVRVANEVHRHVLEYVQGVLTWLDRRYSECPFCNPHDRPQINDPDRKKLSKVNSLMRSLALAIGRESEALRVYNKEKGVDLLPEPDYPGDILSAKSWQDCLENWSIQEANTDEAAKHNFIRKTRVEMAWDSYAQQRAARERADVLLRRFVQATPRRILWCNQLKAMLNAAAWMQVRTMSRFDNDKGLYPLY